MFHVDCDSPRDWFPFQHLNLKIFHSENQNTTYIHVIGIKKYGRATYWKVSIGIVIDLHVFRQVC